MEINKIEKIAEILIYTHNTDFAKSKGELSNIKYGTKLSSMKK